jgi:hypothetical protein
MPDWSQLGGLVVPAGPSHASRIVPLNRSIYMANKQPWTFICHAQQITYPGGAYSETLLGSRTKLALITLKEFFFFPDKWVSIRYATTATVDSCVSHHRAWVWNNDSYPYFYVDGRFSIWNGGGSDDYALTIDNLIGCEAWVDYTFAGWLQYVFIWDRALSPAEIWQHSQEPYCMVQSV